MEYLIDSYLDWWEKAGEELSKLCEKCEADDLEEREEGLICPNCEYNRTLALLEWEKNQPSEYDDWLNEVPF